jgi:hypothetical protein
MPTSMIADSGSRSAAKQCPGTARYVRLDVSLRIPLRHRLVSEEDRSLEFLESAPNFRFNCRSDPEDVVGLAPAPTAATTRSHDRRLTDEAQIFAAVFDALHTSLIMNQ